VSLAAGVLVGPYRLGPLLGRGAMGVVYEATHVSLGRTVALKLVSPPLDDPSFAERFRREGRMQAALHHPNVVTVYEAGTSEHGPYLAMRLVRGTTLAHLIDDGALPADRALRLVGQVADALDAAHAAGLVHRDVKPRNVLVGDDDRAYLADFGLTRLSDSATVTATGHFVGTLAYAAPEVVRGETAGPAADRYALAALLFECLTGTTVFPRPTRAAVLYAHTHEPPPRLSGRREGVPALLDELLIGGLSKQPDHRPRSAAALVDGARVALDGHSLGPALPRVWSPAHDDATMTTDAATAPTPPPSPRSPSSSGGPRPRRRVRWAVALRLGLVAAAAAAAGGAAMALVDDDDDRAGGRALPAAPAGTERLGSTLAAPGRLVDCRGAAVGTGSPSCTMLQDQQRDATLVVPRNGVVRRWGVRSAGGEVALAVLRRRDDGYFQVNRSRNEFVGDGDAHVFTTDLPVDQGDRLALQVTEGSGAGLRPAAGATTLRWMPSLAGAIAVPRTGTAGELLLRADYLPGGTQRLPRRLAGAAAADAADGKVLVTCRARFDDGSALDAQLVLIDGRGVLDLRRAGRRLARIDVPGLSAPVGDVLQLVAVVESSAPQQVGIGVTFDRPGSDRLVRHYYDYGAGTGLQFIN
jgi:hypothetical protein